jgi:RNA-binding protein
MPVSARPLSPTDRRALKGRAHLLHPVVIVGAKGLTDAVLKETDVALNSHELIKVKLASDDREERASQFAALAATLGADPVQQIGKIVTLYRARILAPEAPPPIGQHSPARRARKADRYAEKSRRVGVVAHPKRSGQRRAAADRRGPRPAGSAPSRGPRRRD